MPPPRSPRHAAFGAALRSIRQQAGLSQEELALSTGLDRAYVGGIERGERNPSLTNILRLADTLKTKPSHLLELAERDPRWPGS